MRHLFDEICADGEAALQRLTKDKHQENVQLEFKTKENSSSGEPSKTDKKNFAQALSGFSNSMGGLLVWGVVARPNEDGIDCAQKTNPINNIALFKSRLVSLAGELIAPKNDGVEIESIEVGAQGSGYVLVLVERSDRRPHRSEAGGDKQYYKRIGDSFYPMEHYDIEDAFKRSTTAELHMTYKKGLHGCINFGVANNSSFTAKYPYVRVANLENGYIFRYGLDGNRNFGLPRHRTDLNFFPGGSDDVVHPEQTLWIFAVKPGPRDGSSIRSAAEAVNLMTGPLRIAYEVGCENSRMSRDEIELPTQEICRILEC